MKKTEFNQLYLQLLPKLYNIAMSILRNHADTQDAIQETALKAWMHSERIRNGTEKAYVTRILINECHNILRFRRRTVPVPEIHENPASCDPDLSELKEAISVMPEKLRTALVLVYQESYSYQEAAEALGIHPVALKSRLRRAKAMLKSQLIELKEE